MSRLYLVSSEVLGVVTYYTANSAGALSSIGTTLDFTKGFGDDILPLITNSVYAGLTNGKVWCNDSTTDSIVTIDTNGTGSIMTRKETAVNTKGYSGVNKIQLASYTGSPKIAISFSGNEYFMTRGQGYVPSTTVLLPADVTSRNAIATIDHAYDNLFDGSNTTVVQMANPTSLIPITFAAARKLRKFCGRLSAASLVPAKITLQVYDTTKSAYVDLATINVAAGDTDFSQTFDNSYTTATKYQFKIEYTAGATVVEVEELNVYEEASKTMWLGCSKDEVATKGMDPATLATLTNADYAQIFSNYQLDYYIAVPSGSSVTSVTVTLPPNSAPSVSNFAATPNGAHADDVDISFNVTDPESQSTQYKIVLNTVTLQDFTPTPAGNSVTYHIPNASLKVGSNDIVISAVDELGAVQDFKYTITKVDALPTYVGTLVDNVYSFSINDADGDKVKFKTEFNGNVLEAEGDFTDVPLSHNTVIDKHKIVYGAQNTLTITITDSVGGVTVITETFVGDYYGLLFMDSNSKFLTNDLGDLLETLDFGIVVSGRPSVEQEILVLNKTKGILKSVALNGPGDFTGGKGATVELSLASTFKDVHQNLSIGDMTPSQIISVYARINSVGPNIVGDFSFQFNGKGTEV